MTSVSEDRVAAVRGFNRFYTARIGVLREGLLHTPYSLTEARVIFELAQGERLEVADLRRALDVDAGYLSRILSRFEAAGLVTRERSASDARRQVAALTASGRAEFAILDERSAAETSTLLSGLAEDEQRRLLGSMDVIRGILGRATAREHVSLRSPRPGDFGWIVERHGALYALEYGWDDSFEALVARIVTDYLEQRDPAREAAWVAELDGDRAGCVLCVREDDRTARLRLLLVEPAARGVGIGGRLIDECIAFARAAGYERLTLWTNDVLVEARRLYERRGFVLVEEQTHHSFGHDLVGQSWTLDL
jgi:DNA-binding MarR family transcriptional regulator/GNAT superfamily N-acetyltransferase